MRGQAWNYFNYILIRRHCKELYSIKEKKLCQIHFNNMREIFKSTRYFTFFDFVISHGQLLLRSQKNDELGNNIDIIFFGTTYIQAFSRLNGLRLSRIENSISGISYSSVKKYLEYE